MQFVFNFEQPRPKRSQFCTVIFDSLKSADFPYCVDCDQVLWGVANARKSFLDALSRHRSGDEKYSVNRAYWLSFRLMHLGGVGGIW